MPPDPLSTRVALATGPDDARVKAVEISDDHVTFTLIDDRIHYIAAVFADEMKRIGAVHYISWRVNHPELGSMTLQLARDEGETAADVAEQRKVEIATLRARIEALEDALREADAALEPFASVAGLSVITTARHEGYCLTVSNGLSEFIMLPGDFIDAKVARAAAKNAMEGK